MSKVDEALVAIAAIEDPTERALMLGGLTSTLMKIKNVLPVIVGQTAFECYTNAENGTGQLLLSIHTGKINPRFTQEIFSDQLHGKGLLDEWKVAEINVKVEEEFNTENRDLCRDFTTDYGIVKLMPAEDLTASKLWAATRPGGEQARDQAQLLLMCALAGDFAMDWPVLEKLCESPVFNAGAILAELKVEAQEALDAETGAAVEETNPPA